MDVNEELEVFVKSKKKKIGGGGGGGGRGRVGGEGDVNEELKFL